MKTAAPYIFLADVCISAGFPSPAERAHEHRLHIDDLIVRHPEATFFVKMDSDAMEGFGVFKDDILVIDRAKAPRHGSMVLVAREGEFIVRRLMKDSNGWTLASSHPAESRMQVSEDLHTVVWGVVTHSVHSV